MLAAGANMAGKGGFSLPRSPPSFVERLKYPANSIVPSRERARARFCLAG